MAAGRFGGRGRRIALWSVLGVVAVLLAGCDFEFSASTGDTGGTFDAVQLGGEIAADLSAQLGGDFEVDCPEDQPVEPGSTFECEAVDETGQVGIIGVTVVDEDGNVDWELLEIIDEGAAAEDADSQDEAAADGDVAEFDAAQLGGVIADDLSAQLGGGFEVVCPDDQPMRTGTSFECQATDDAGQTGVIAVTAVDDTGNVDWELVDIDDGQAAADDAQAAPVGPEDVARPADVPDDWEVFAEPGAGFTLWHPAGWEASRGTERDWSFSGPPGDPLESVSVAVSTYDTAAAGGPYDDKVQMAETFLEQIQEFEHEILSDGVETDIIPWQADNDEVAVYAAFYVFNGDEFGDLVVVGEFDDQTLARLTYTAPVMDFDRGIEEAAAVMIESFDNVPTG